MVAVLQKSSYPFNSPRLLSIPEISQYYICEQSKSSSVRGLFFPRPISISSHLLILTTTATTTKAPVAETNATAAAEEEVVEEAVEEHKWQSGSSMIKPALPRKRKHSFFPLLLFSFSY